MNSRILILAASLLFLGGLAGWSLAPSPNRGADSQEADPPKATVSSRSATSSSRSGGRVSEDSRMRAIRDSRNEGERMHSAIALAKSLPLDQAGKWLDEGLFSQREGYALTLFTKILEQRWRTEDPNGYLIWQLGNGRSVSTEEMARLSENNPELLLSSIRLIQDPNSRSAAIANLAKVRPDLALAELAKMDVAELRNTGNFGGIFREMAQSDLATLQAAVEGLPFALQGEAQKAIFGQLLAKDFSGALSQLVDLPNGFEILMSDSSVISKNRQGFLESFASLPKSWQKKLEDSTYSLTNGMEYDEVLSTDWESYGVSEKSAGRLKGYSLFQEARNDKAKALELFQSAGLNEAGRRYFLDMLKWNNGQETIQALKSHLEPADWDYVSKDLESYFGTMSQSGTQKTAAEISEDLAKTDHLSLSFANYSWAMQQWSAEEKAQFQTDYATMQGEERHRVTAMLVNSRDLEQRVAAVTEILGSPAAQEVAGWKEAPEVTSKLAVDLLQQDAERATTWVGGLPEGDSRSWAMKNLAANWKNLDPVAAGNWVNSLPAAERAEVREYLKNPGN
ncbi:hypothetical protein V2O64_16960 [Verrucomicrobiaceae bacterium 227]